MANYTDTSVKELIINKLTKAQYDAAVQAGTINENELYMVTDTTYPTSDEFEAGLATKVNKVSEANRVYGTDSAGEQTTYDLNSFGKVDDVKVNGVSVVVDKIANLGSMASESKDDYSYTNAFATVAFSGEYEDLLNKPTVDQVYNAQSANAQSGVAVASAISSAISAVYKPAGSSAFAGLPTPGASNLGNVYNMSEEFTIDDRFVDYDSSATKTYPAGTNVVVVNTGTDSDPVYKFDVLTGFIDLSPYALTNSLSAVALSGEYEDLLNKPTVDQVYNAQSANAQSGVAVASAISDMQVVSNMVDVVSKDSTNTTYATASAVYNIVDTKSTVTFRNWSAS